MAENQVKQSGKVQVAGIILAAGASSRLGHPKPLLDWFGRPFVKVIVQTSLTAGLSPVIVTAGTAIDGIRQCLTGLPVCVVENPDWQEGMSTSMQAGLTALPEGVGGAMFLLVDQPHLPSSLLKALMDEHARSRADYVVPMVDGKQSNPALFDRSMFPALLKITGDKGGRAIFQQCKPSFVEWKDKRIILDVDTGEDYQKLVGLYTESSIPF